MHAGLAGLKNERIAVNIAIVGSGISGLTCAHLLKDHRQVTLFEQNDSLGGHTATRDVVVEGRHYAIDTGFIVFNDRTYPRFEKLLDRIGMPRQNTEMSFSVKNLASGLEYNGHTLNTLFAQRRNLLNPRFYQFLGEIVRFNRRCKALLRDVIPDHLTVGKFLQAEGFSERFARNYLLPMGAAIWSTSLDEFLHFPLDFFLRFFANHGLLNLVDRPQWYVIPGGSRSYIAPLLAGIPPERIRLNADIARVRRNADGVTLETSDGRSEHFDQVILACHSDQALALLAEPTETERSILGAIPYQMNDVVLHTDGSLMPKRRLAWASWNYLLTGAADETTRPASVTYCMNILQGIQSDTPFLVTLNPVQAIDESKVLGRFRYAHPSYTMAGMAARQRRDEICGVDRVHFCGAYWYNGFHEDGVHSAIDVCYRFGVPF
jgi:hypothetical protein